MITGGGSGMGLLSGEKLAGQGANVALLDVNEEALAAAEAKIKAAGGNGGTHSTCTDNSHFQNCFTHACSFLDPIRGYIC